MLPESPKQSEDYLPDLDDAQEQTAHSLHIGGPTQVEVESEAEVLAASAPTKERSTMFTGLGKLQRLGRAILKRSATDMEHENAEYLVDETVIPTAPKFGEWKNWNTPDVTARGNKTSTNESGRRYEKELPKFSDQVADTSRTNVFSYRSFKQSYGAYGEEYEPDAKTTTMTEHEGLIALQAALEMIIANGVDTDEARGMLDNMSFIGEKEYAEAAPAMGGWWKTYLDENSNNILFIPLATTGNSDRKSDAYLMDRILNTFSDDEMAQYKGRIVTSFDMVNQPPKRTKVVLLDDWTVSGAQMEDAYRQIAGNEQTAPYAKNVEMQLITGSGFHHKYGLSVHSRPGDSVEWSNIIPVRSYFKNHNADRTAVYGNGGHVTGIHSSVDHNFESLISGSIARMNRISEAKGQGRPYLMPPLTGVVRSYRKSAPLVTIEQDGTIHRN